MADESSVYPGSLDVFTDKEAKKDKVSKSDMNKVQNAIEAIEAELGLDPAGSLATLKARLAVALADNGAMQQGTSFPVSGLVDGQMFYRNDRNIMYIYNGSTWDAQGQSLSNVVYQYQAAMEGVIGSTSSAGSGEVIANDFTDGQTAAFRYIQSYPDTLAYRTVLSSKWKKDSGISTLTVYCQLWGDAKLQLSVGGQTGSYSSGTDATPTWYTFDVDVSSLSNGTVYDVLVQIGNSSTITGSNASCGSIIAFGS